jgi:hypothetical protein
VGFSDKMMGDFIKKNVLQSPAWGDSAASSSRSDSGTSSPAGFASPSPQIVGVIFSDGRMSQS